MMKQRLVLITGATAGIGQALVHLAAQKELKLLITGRNQEELKKLTDTFGSLIVQAVAADLSQEEGVKTIIDLIHKHCPDIIINNAGFGLYGEALSYSTVQQKHIVDVNVNAVLQLSLEGARALISQVKQGVILNVSSAISFQVAPNMAVYAATKAFINQFSQSLDEELKPLGIRVLVACPGMVKTEFSQNAGMTRTRKFTAVMSSKFVARAIWKQIESLTPLTIIDWKYRLLTWLSYLIPKKIVTAIIKNNIAERIAPRNVIRLPSCKNK
ncbi:SDR family NAD(P)-dependent oxidoreductase [Candidatus Protochlamydia sp. W-9]|uniref:SDR family NAD(P)-dependent oxidoreductase n=1 Tax=Candidatus Protochlamydia sp. W-9 TaxID=1785087 RepID=UPI00096A2B19|nr:SDR family NAD(P)-dependent oxidoreductase [Candidatus Protochlamydia sp. W-9]